MDRDSPERPKRRNEAALPQPWIEVEGGHKHRFAPAEEITIHTVDYPVGSQKTRSAIPFAIRDSALNDQRYIICFPTRKLIRQAMEIAQPLIDRYGVMVQAVEAKDRDEDEVSTYRSRGNDNVSWAVKSAVRRLRQLLGIDPPPMKDGIPEVIEQPAVIICTHRALRLVGSHDNLANWHVIQDEVTDPVESPDLQLTRDNINLLTNRFAIWSGVLPGYYYLEERAISPFFHDLKRVEENQDSDEVFKSLMKIVEPYRAGAALFVPKGVWDRTVGTQQQTVDENVVAVPETDLGPEPRTKRGSLHIAVLHSPWYCRQFKTYTIMSAAFTDTLLYKAWSHRYRVNWVPHSIIKGTYTRHDMDGRKVKIGYLNEHLLTKSKRDQWEVRDRELHPHSPPKTLPQAAIEVAERAFDLDDIQEIENEDGSRSTGAYLFVTNNDVRDRELRPSKLRIRMPNVSHGRNSWQNVNQMLFFSALNPDNMTLRFMKASCSITEAEIQTCRNYLTVYQAAGRTSMRNSGLTPEQATSPLFFIVPDKATAEWLAQWFINCADDGPQVFRVGDMAWDPPERPGRRPLGERAMSEAERSKRYTESLSEEEKAARRVKQADLARKRRALKREERKIMQASKPTTYDKAE